MPLIRGLIESPFFRSGYVCNFSQLRMARRSFCIEKIDACASKVFTKDFLHSEDFLKLKCLEAYSWKEYKINNIQEKTIEKAEQKFQVLLAADPSLLSIRSATPGTFSPKSTSIFWSSERHHTVRAPFKQGSVKSKHEDKDEALDMLSKLIGKGTIKLQDDVILLAKGCDNNEAAVKLRLYMAIELKKRTHMIATDVNFNALSRARGLDLLVQEKLFNHTNISFPLSNIIVRDMFNHDDPLIIKGQIGQRIAMPFRLTALTPLEKLEKQITALINKNDICVMHFFEDTSSTTKALTNEYKYSKRSQLNKGNTEISYCHGNGLDISIWKQDVLRTFIHQQGGHVLEMKQVITESDTGAKINLLICIVEKK